MLTKFLQTERYFYMRISVVDNGYNKNIVSIPVFINSRGVFEWLASGLQLYGQLLETQNCKGLFDRFFSSDDKTNLSSLLLSADL